MFQQWYVTLNFQCTLVCGLGSGRGLDAFSRFYCIECMEEEFNWPDEFIVVGGVPTATIDTRYDTCEDCSSIDSRCRRCYPGDFDNDGSIEPICEECEIPFEVSGTDPRNCVNDVCFSADAPYEAAGVTIVCLNDCLSGDSPINYKCTDCGEYTGDEFCNTCRQEFGQPTCLSCDEVDGVQKVLTAAGDCLD